MQPLLKIRGLGVFTKAPPVGAALGGGGMKKSAFHVLSVAPAATYGRLDIPLFDKFFAKLALGGSCGRFPIQIGDLIQRAKIIFRSAVAFEAPTHAVRFRMVDHLHMVDIAVAGNATDPAIHVNGVIEIDVIRGLMDSDPRNGVAGFP